MLAPNQVGHDKGYAAGVQYRFRFVSMRGRILFMKFLEKESPDIDLMIGVVFIQGGRIRMNFPGVESGRS